MLHKSWISDIEIYSDRWNQERLGKFTSSKNHCLFTKKPLTADGVSYIHQKVGELLTGQSNCGEDDKIENEHTAWGVINEPLALREFAAVKGINYLVVGKMIHQPGSRFSSTPDALWVISSSITKEDHYNVASVEVKCPHKFNTFIPLYRCKTPADLKSENSNYYWQVLDQMDNCMASIGYFAVHHPLFPVGNNLRIIEFKQIDLWDDFAFLQQRKAQALEVFNQTVAEFLAQKA